MQTTAVPSSETWPQLLQLHPHPAGARCRHRQRAWEAGAGKGGTLRRQSLSSVSTLKASVGTVRSIPSRSAHPGSLRTKRIVCVTSCCWAYYLFYPSARQMEKLSLEGYKSGQFIHLYCSGSAGCWRGTTARPWEGTPWRAALSARSRGVGFDYIEQRGAEVMLPISPVSGESGLFASPANL